MSCFKCLVFITAKNRRSLSIKSKKDLKSPTVAADAKKQVSYLNRDGEEVLLSDQLRRFTQSMLESRDESRAQSSTAGTYRST